MVDTQRNSFNFKSLIFISFIITLIVFIIFLSTFSIRKTDINSNKTKSNSFISFNNLNEKSGDLNLVLKEQAIIFDSEPIFIPTEWNEALDPFKNIAKDSLFQDFPPVTTLYDQKMLLTITHEYPAISSPSGVLNSKFINPFIGINQNTPNTFPLKKRTAYVTVKNLNTSKIVEEYEIISDPDIQMNDQLWVPMEFLLIVDESGPIMPLLITESSGTEQIDNYFKNHIPESQLKLSSLPAGYYKILVSP